MRLACLSAVKSREEMCLRMRADAFVVVQIEFNIHLWDWHVSVSQSDDTPAVSHDSLSSENEAAKDTQDERNVKTNLI